MYTLRELRDEQGWTLQQTADRLGVHWNTVSRWERNEVNMSEPLKRLVALTFGKPFDTIAYPNGTAPRKRAPAPRDAGGG